jgi:hypothetical protein
MALMVLMLAVLLSVDHHLVGCKQVVWSDLAQDQPVLSDQHRDHSQARQAVLALRYLADIHRKDYTGDLVLAVAPLRYLAHNRHTDQIPAVLFLAVLVLGAAVPLCPGHNHHTDQISAVDLLRAAHLVGLFDPAVLWAVM